jgi:ABC-type Fe3+/spermidine/putrescine transport system ATPase subunit
LNAGRIEQIDHPEIVFKHPVSEFTFRFLGESFFLPAIVEPQGGLRLDGGVHIAAPSSLSGKSGPTRIYFRPSWLKLGAAAANCDTRITGRLVLREFLGDIYRYHVKVGDSVLKADNTALLDLTPGETVTLGWAAADAVVYQ